MRTTSTLDDDVAARLKALIRKRGRHQKILGSFLDLPRITSRLVADAHGAALAVEHGLTCRSTDDDLSGFPGLKWENPIAAGA